MKLTLAGLMLLACLAASQVSADAFCALRDPTTQINELYPEHSGFRSIVDRIDSEVKLKVAEQLPFTLHDRELGKHTLYVVLKDQQPLGLVHVRSEPSPWGLIEIVWSLGLDMRVRDFRFQRCRDRGCKVLQAEDFRTLLRGKDWSELNGLLRDAAKLPVATQHQHLAEAVVKSAMKTLMVTEVVWGDSVANIAVRD